MSSETFHGQSTKETYRSDIQDSLNQQTIYKTYEYFDDVSYGDSDKAGLLIKRTGDRECDVYLFQPDGPKTKVTLQKLLEWRRSGHSDEVGHKGGGNLRNIYGFKSKRTSVYMKHNGCIMRCTTYPNKILDMATSDISEADFRDRVDTSEFITVPENIDESELPGWYPSICGEIRRDFQIEPNYLIRMELTTTPSEYGISDKWTEYIHQLRAKQYDFPIRFKNELLGMEQCEECNNIDVVGLKSKEDEMTIKLYICSSGTPSESFCIKSGNTYISLNGGEITDTNHLLHWGDISMFIANKEYINQQIKEYNDRLTYKLRAEDVYGVFFMINNKLTNYKALSLTGGVLPQGKNNKIINWKQSSNYFRMIITPNNDTCLDPHVFNALINTNTIKARTEFLDKGPYKEIIKKSVDLYRGEKPEKTIASSPKKKDVDKLHIGGYYIGYIGKDLWKHGIVETMANFDDRIRTHKRESIDKVLEFTRETITHETFTVFLKLSEVPVPALFEQKAIQLLNNHRSDVTLFTAKNGSKDREYFLCKGDFITQTIIPEIRGLIE